jgi:hypothetical protein
MASAANMAIPVHDIDMPARCGPTEAGLILRHQATVEAELAGA